VIAYWSESGALVFAIIDYYLYLLDGNFLKYTAVRNEILHIKRFMEYLGSREITFAGVRDESLVEFRDSELEDVRKKANRSLSDAAHKRTVNGRLRRVYHFLSWLQEVARDQTGLIGLENARVRSSLNVKQQLERRQRGFSKERYPLVFRGVGEGSKHRTSYCATEEDLDFLQAYFASSMDGGLARRNILLLDIGLLTGLRRGAVNSLKCEQFTREAIDTAADTFEVVPDQQKFGYANSFDFPIRLADRIRDYIDGPRAEMLAARNWEDEDTGDRIFLSFRDGKPLADRTISQIFGDAFAILDPKLRAAYHALRHKFGNVRIEQEVEARLELGLDTSVSSIAAALAVSMGHASPSSIEPYVSRQMSRFRGKRATSADRVAELERENLELKREIARLQEKGE
jgi:integrase